jgi:hypothetical protein
VDDEYRSGGADQGDVASAVMAGSMLAWAPLRSDPPTKVLSDALPATSSACLVVLALRLTIRELAQSTLHLLHELTTQPKIQEFSPKSGTAPKSDLIAPLPSHFPADSQLPLAMVQESYNRNLWITHSPVSAAYLP